MSIRFNAIDAVPKYSNDGLYIYIYIDYMLELVWNYCQSWLVMFCTLYDKVCM
jgi:hypothetical protein